jgi:YHS domain-containing protein
MTRSLKLFVLLGTAVAGIGFAGCSKPITQLNEANGGRETKKVLKAEAGGVQEHSHISGAHGGIVIPIGSDSYHAEAVIEKNGIFRLLTLGADESRIQEVDSQTVKAYVKAVGESDAAPIEMKAVPQEGDSEGKTSQFVGQLPESAIGKAIEVTIPNLWIGGERFRIGFSTAVASHDTGMPGAVTGMEEQKLYFTPAGKYTQADIDANGKLSAAAKFKGFMSKHDMAPKPGDLICPVTFTKANPKIEWTVDGKKYLFCCPPCVDEFVRMAKEEPDQIKAPEEYIQKNGLVDLVDPEVTAALADLSTEDRLTAVSQKFCAVATDNLLGSMGTPIRVDIDGKPVFLCCDGCKARALRDPEATLAKVTKLKSENASK